MVVMIVIKTEGVEVRDKGLGNFGNQETKRLSRKEERELKRFVEIKEKFKINKEKKERKRRKEKREREK